MQTRIRAVVRQRLTSDKSCKFCQDEMPAGTEADFINDPLEIVCVDCGETFVRKGRGVRETRKAPPEKGEAGPDRTAGVNHGSEGSIAIANAILQLAREVREIKEILNDVYYESEPPAHTPAAAAQQSPQQHKLEPEPPPAKDPDAFCSHHRKLTNAQLDQLAAQLNIKLPQLVGFSHLASMMESLDDVERVLREWEQKDHRLLLTWARDDLALFREFAKHYLPSKAEMANVTPFKPRG